MLYYKPYNTFTDAHFNYIIELEFSVSSLWA